MEEAEGRRQGEVEEAEGRRGGGSVKVTKRGDNRAEGRRRGEEWRRYRAEGRRGGDVTNLMVVVFTTCLG